jgi:hypothetical protein
LSDPNLLREDGHERAGLRLIRRAIHGRWEIPAVLLDQLPKQVVSVMVSARTDRDKLRAAEVLVAMNRDNLSALSIADKVERLERGEATERIEAVQAVTDEQIAAVAKMLASRGREPEPSDRKNPRRDSKPKVKAARKPKGGR